MADAIAAKSAHSAALLDGELDPAIVDDVRAAGVELLPGPGDLRPHCSCPDWAEPCKHAAAVCYLVAAELDRDPVPAVPAPRHRPRRAGRDGPRPSAGRPPRRNPGGRWPASRRRSPGRVVTLEARGDRSTWPHPACRRRSPPRQPRRRVPGRPLAWDAHVAEGDRIDPQRVDELAVDATERAWLMLVDGAPSGLASSVRGDLARRAVAAARGRELATLAAPDAPVGRRRCVAWADGLEARRRRRRRSHRGRGCLVDRPGSPCRGRDQLVELGVPETVGRAQLRQPRHAEGRAHRDRTRRAVVPAAGAHRRTGHRAISCTSPPARPTTSPTSSRSRWAEARPAGSARRWAPRSRTVPAATR